MERIESAAALRSFYNKIVEANGGHWFDFEPVIQGVYEAVLQRCDTAIDGGAHIGRHTIPMAFRVGEGGAVLAFEPVHRTAWLLQARIRVCHPELTRVIRIEEVALSNMRGHAEFFAMKASAFSGLRHRSYPQPDEPASQASVRLETLDAACLSCEKLKFIKLDLEGGEFHALLGSEEILRLRRPVVAFEYDYYRTPSLYGFHHAEFLDFLDKLDYQVVDVLGIPFSNRNLWQAASVWYYFAVPREQWPHEAVLQAIRLAIAPFVKEQGRIAAHIWEVGR